MRLASGYIVDSYSRKTVLLTFYFLFMAFFFGYFFAGWSLLIFAVLRTLHGAPFGAVTVANSTVAIDVLHPSRRAEGIGYYGLGNNIATAISPTVGIYIYEMSHDYNLIFLIAALSSCVGWVINSTLKLPSQPISTEKTKFSWSQIFLVKGWSEGISMACFAFSYGVLSTYLAIYGKECLGIVSGTGTFFMVLCIGLIISRLYGSKSLRKGKIVENASIGICISVIGYLLFAAVHNNWGYYGAAAIIGLGNGHMFPAFQNMFINLAPDSRRGSANSSLLCSWDIGIGIGILIGGAVSELFSYYMAFWLAWIINTLGALFFFVYVRRNFQHNRLRI